MLRYWLLAAQRGAYSGFLQLFLWKWALRVKHNSKVMFWQKNSELKLTGKASDSAENSVAHLVVNVEHQQLTLPLLSLEVQQPPSAPPHCSLRADTSLSSLSRRSRRAAKSVSQPQDPEAKPDGTSLILWVRTRGEPGVRSISLPEKRREEHAELKLGGEENWDLLRPGAPKSSFREILYFLLHCFHLTAATQVNLFAKKHMKSL